jgi:ribose transport system ATP-binding protein
MTNPNSPVAADAFVISGLSKSYPGTVALSDFDLSVAKGEVHALIGGNGSGKSTFIKILAGVLPATTGSLRMAGAEYDLTQFTNADARRSGVHVVHQHRTTFLSLSVAENLTIGRGFERNRFGGIRWGAVKVRTEELLKRYGIDVDPSAMVSTLSPRSQTLLEIARALQDQSAAGGDVLALDEPTAALSPQEADHLIQSLRECAAAGQAVLFISHRLDEVLAVADRITVIRDGKRVATVSRSEATRDTLVELMVGGDVPRVDHSAAPDSGTDAAVTIRNLSGGTVADTSFSVKAGEIVGIAGLAGSGRSTLLRLLFGAQSRTGGEMSLGGEPYAPRDPSDAIKAGVAYVPEDRAGDAIFGHMSVMENLSIAGLRAFATRFRLRPKRELTATADSSERFQIKTPGPAASISSLSGGNQQKVSVARWLIRKPRLLLLDEPTQGVDVEARAHLWQTIRHSAQEGCAVLLVSSDLEELTTLSDRLIVMRQGRLVGELAGPGLAPVQVDRSLHTAGVGI